MRYAVIRYGLILAAMIACSNPVAPTAEGLTPPNPKPHSDVPAYHP